jgi:hypothetical protein
MKIAIGTATHPSQLGTSSKLAGAGLVCGGTPAPGMMMIG